MAAPSMHQLRTISILAVVGAATIVLLLSDRAGVLFGDTVTELERLARTFEARSGLDFIDRADIPVHADQIGHALFWGSVMTVVGWLLRRRVPLHVTAFGLITLGTLLEFVQPLVSTRRAGQSRDAIANVVGIGGGTIVLIAIILIERLVRRNKTAQGVPLT